MELYSVLHPKNSTIRNKWFERKIEQQVYDIERTTGANEVSIKFSNGSLIPYSCSLFKFGSFEWTSDKLLSISKHTIVKQIYKDEENIGFLHTSYHSTPSSLNKISCTILVNNIQFVCEDFLSSDYKYRTRENLLRFIEVNMRLKDLLTYNHSQMVQIYASYIGSLAQMSEKEIDDLRICGLLHDIGKLVVPSGILLKPNKLTAEEFNEIKKHPIYGFAYLANYYELNDYAPIVLHHHERWDGSGYPEGLQGDKIPVMARIIAIADAFDAMVNQRVYKEPLSTFVVEILQYTPCSRYSIQRTTEYFCSLKKH